MVNGKPKYETWRLHRWLLNIDKGYKIKIDHHNHNGLDNRKNNLRISKNKENTKNRSSKNSNNTSGYRNVSWDKYYEQWKVQLQVDGKNKIFGYFDDVHEAGEYATIKRNELYGEFAGESS